MQTSTLVGIGGKQREIDALAVPCGAHRIGQTLANAGLEHVDYGDFSIDLERAFASFVPRYAPITGTPIRTGCSRIIAI